LHRKHKTLVIIIIAAACAVLIALAVLFLKNMPGKIREYLNPKGPTALNGGPVSANGGQTGKYIDDVVYTGPIKYPELYDYPFGKSDLYVRNKDFKGDKDKIYKTAESFIKAMYGGGYRDIASDAEGYRDAMLTYFDESGALFMDIGPVTGGCILAGDYADKMSDYIVTNMVNAEANLVTNASMVYSDGYIWVRGMIEQETYNTDGGTETGSETIMVDIALKTADDSIDGYKVCGIIPVDTPGQEEQKTE